MRDNTNAPWILIAFGAFALLCTLYNLYTGRMQVSRRHRWGFVYYFDLVRDESPFLFWIQIFIQILVGGGALGYGIMLLVEGPKTLLILQ